MTHLKSIEIDEIETEVIIDFDITPDGIEINFFKDKDGNKLDLWRSQNILSELEEEFAQKRAIEIGCGYCQHEKKCPIHDPKVNKAKQGCQEFTHYLTTNYNANR